MSNKTTIIIFCLMIVLILYGQNFSEDNYEIETPKVLIARFLNYSVAKNWTNARVEYTYKGKTYKNLHIHQNVTDCFETNEEVLIKIDSLYPKKLVFIPDTFIAYYDIHEDQKKLKYDTLIAYDTDLYKNDQYMEFKV